MCAHYQGLSQPQSYTESFAVTAPTDVTRTVAVGEPSADQRRMFTLVLKAHIAMATIRFPPGTSGMALDAIARAPLWHAGLDYDHGTGHGVGSYLGVHEGPQRIAKWGTSQPLLEGMILSNEPGYYKSGEYGIRIENLVLVEERAIAGAEGRYFGFETLTFAPIDKNLVDVSLLNADELRWWNEYHIKVFEIVGPQLEGAALAWATGACAALAA
jgi:Xaa-Pro aminopeptidase